MDTLFLASRKYQAADKARRMPIRRTLTSFFKRKLYNITETWRFRCVEPDGDIVTKFRTITFRGTLAKIRIERAKFLTKTTKNFTDSDIEVLERTRLAQSYVSLTTPLNPLAIPLEDINALDINGFIPASEYQIGVNTCVADYLRHRYPNIKGLPDAPPTSYDILRICQANRINLRVIDHDNERILTHEAKKTRPLRTPALWYMIKNGHMYPFTEKRLVSARNGNRKNAKKQKVVAKTPPTEFGYNSNSLLPLEFLVRKMELAHKEPEKITLFKDTIHFDIDDKCFVCKTYEHCTPIRKYCKANDIPYTGQHSAVPFAKPIAKVALPSTFNDKVYQVFKQCDKTITHMGRTTEVYPPNCETIDLVKCHRNCLLSPLQGWFVFSTLDEFKPHSTYKGVPGFYVTKSTDTQLLKGDGLYSNAILDHAKRHGISFTVSHLLKPSDIQPKQIFKAPIQSFMQTKGDTKFKKGVVNRIAGILGVFHQPSYDLKVNTNFQQVCNDIHKYGPDDNLLVRKVNDYWVYGKERKDRKFNTTRPMYLQILEQANIMLFDVQRRIISGGGTIHFRYSDEIHYTGCEPIEETTTDTHKPTNIKHPELYDMEEPNEYEFDIQPKRQWDEQAENDSSQDIASKLLEGGCIQGPGGTGKTYVLKKLKALLTQQGKSFQCLALTNAAARLIDGKTLHKYFSMGNGDVCAGKAIRPWTMDDYLIVDEMSMIPKVFYNILNEAKTIAKCKVILMGDFHQLPPVGERHIDHKNTFVIRDMCDHKLWGLTKNYRAQDDLPAFLQEITELPNNLILPMVRGRFQTASNPADMYEAWNIGYNKYENPYGFKINKTLNDGHAQLRGVLTIGKYKVVPNMRVICNTKSGDICKNTILKVQGFTGATMTLTDGETSTDIPEATFWEKFDMAYCITVEKAQGQTLSGHVYIHQLDDILKDRDDYRKCYTALGRATAVANVFIATL